MLEFEGQLVFESGEGLREIFLGVIFEMLGLLRFWACRRREVS